MRVLLISHNVISTTNNMGKTLLSYFHAFEPDEIAEFYIQDKEPQNATIAKRFFRVTDRDALKSLLGKHVGKSFVLDCSKSETASSLTGAVESIRQYGRRRNAFVYTARNAVWALSHWKTKELVSWLKDFNPDVLFFMSGDYSFMYRITLDIQKLLNIPLVVCCVDDYYLFNRNESSVLGRLQHRAFMKTVHKLMDKAGLILTISDSMGDAYKELFNKQCRTLHTSAEKRITDNADDGKGIAYFGNLSFRRYEQLIEIGKAIKALGIDGIRGIDVYSAETSQKYLQELRPENGVYFHGAISSDEVAKRMDSCMAIIHTESFNEHIRRMIRYSVSTKIADSLLNGPCLIAYGPGELASIDYLRKNSAAYVITRPEDLEPGLRIVLTDSALREQIVHNARELGSKNHDDSVNPLKVRAWLEEAIAEPK